jgi:hypothetical protein
MKILQKKDKNEHVDDGTYEVRDVGHEIRLNPLMDAAKEGHGVRLDDESYARLVEIRRWLRSNSGSGEARRFLGKTGRSITLSDASKFTLMHFKI